MFDTSAYITAWRIHYRPTTVPMAPIWELFDACIRDGSIILPREVYRELKDKDDDLFAWIDVRRDFVTDPTPEVMAEVPAIAALVKGGATVHDRADPWVIAEAKTRGFMVITNEGTNALTGEPTKKANRKMPGICHQLGIECGIIIDGLEKLGRPPGRPSN